MSGTKKAEVPPMSLEEGVTVRKEGGVQEIKHADIKIERREEYNAKIKQEQEAERIALEKACQARDEAQAHRKLQEEAEQLKNNKLQQSEAEAKEVEQFAQRVNQLKLEEAEAEKRRAEIHRQAVEVEEQRVKALSSKTLHVEEAREAAKLAAQHQEGQKYSEALAKQYDYEVQEAQLRQRKLEAMVEQVITGTPIPLTAAAAKIHVEVKPQALPEQRELGGEVPSIDRREAMMREKIPEEFAHRAAEIDTASALNKQTKTSVEVKKEEKSISQSQGTEQRGVAADIVNAFVGVLTGQKQ